MTPDDSRDPRALFIRRTQAIERGRRESAARPFIRPVVELGFDCCRNTNDTRTG